MSGQPRPPMRVLPARAGMEWLTASFVLIRAQPGRLLLLTMLMQAVLGLSQVPLLGIFVILAVPALSAGLLQAFRMVDAGQRPPLAVLFAALAARPTAGRLLVLGALLFAAGIVTVSLALGVGGPDPELLARIEQGDIDALSEVDPGFLYRVALALAIAVSVSGVLSFLTIPLIAFSGMQVGAGLATGLRAMWINWRPFLMLGLGLGALMAPVAILFGLALEGAGSSAMGSLLALALVLVILLLFQLVVFGTQYCAHRAIFGAHPGAARPAAEGGSDDGGQLVA